MLKDYVSIFLWIEYSVIRSINSAWAGEGQVPPASSSGSTPIEAPAAHTDWKEVFFLVQELHRSGSLRKLFIICGEDERNIPKHWFSFSAEVFLFGFVIGK